MTNAPDLGVGGEAALPPEVVSAVRRAGFTALQARESLTLDQLATSAGVSGQEASEVVAALVRRGTATVDADGRLDGIAGLTVRPTRHLIERDGARLHTWCAFDAVGIPVAFGWTAAAVTPCGYCGAGLRVSLEQGIPPMAGDLWGWMPPTDCDHVLHDFCTAADLFCNRAHLDAWRAAAGDPPGRPVPVEELAETARTAWEDCVPTASAADEEEQ